MNPERIPSPGDPDYAEYVQKQEALGGKPGKQNTGEKTDVPPPDVKQSQQEVEESARKEAGNIGQNPEEKKFQGDILSQEELARYKELGKEEEMNEEYRLAQLNTQRDLQKRRAEEEGLVPVPKEQEVTDLVPVPGKEKATKDIPQLEGPPERLALKGRPERLALPPHPEQPALPPHEQPALPPHEQLSLPPHKEKRRIAFVRDPEAMARAARDIAAARLTEKYDDMPQKGWWKRRAYLFKKGLKQCWKNSLFEPIYRKGAYREALMDIKKNKSLYVDEGTSEAEIRQKHKEEMAAMVGRFTSDFEESIHKEAGEEKKVLEQQDPKLNENIRALIRDYAQGAVDDNEFGRRRNEIYSEVTGVSQREISENIGYVDNLLEIAQEAKKNYDHGEGLAALDNDFEIILGQAKAGVRTKEQFDCIDRLMDKIVKNPVGRYVNEATLGLLVATGANIGRRIATSVLYSKVANLLAIGGPAALGGALGAAQERRRMELDRQQHFREMAKGKDFERVKAETPRRTEMEQYRYETKSVQELMADLETRLYATRTEGSRTVKDLDEAGFQDALAQLAEIDARTRLSDREQIDLISYSDATKVEQERDQLDMLRGQARADLEDIMRARGIKLEGTKSLQEYLETESGIRQNTLLGEKSEKDKAFSRTKNWQATKYAGKAAVRGVALGFTVSEVLAFVLKGQEGLLEGLTKGRSLRGRAVPEGARMTPLLGLRHFVESKLGVAGASAALAFETQQIMDANGQPLGGKVRLPKGYSLVDSDGDGKFELWQKGADKPLANDITFDPKTGEMRGGAALTDQGIGVKNTPDNILDGGEKVPRSMKEIMQEKAAKGEAVPITHDSWADNMTVRPDLNEIKLHYGGVNGTGLDESGRYACFDVSRMRNDGSFTKDFTLPVRDLIREGKIKLMCYASEDSQGFAIPIEVPTDGQIRIDLEGELGKMGGFRAGPDGLETGFKFVEVDYVTGQEGGVHKIISVATHTGEGLSSKLEDVIPRGVPDVEIIPPPVRPETEIWNVPIGKRRNLEAMKKKAAEQATPETPQTPPPATGEAPVEAPTQTTTEGPVEPPPVIPIGERTPLEPSRKKEEQAGEVEKGKKLTPEQIENREEFVQDSLQPTFNRWERENGVKVTSVDLEETSPGEGKLTINIDPEGMPYDNRVQLIAAGAQEIKTDEGAHTLIWEIPITKGADERRADVNEVIHYIEGIGAGFVLAAGAEGEKAKGSPTAEEDKTKAEGGKKPERPKRPARIRPEVKVNAGEAAETPAEPDLTFEEWDGVNQDVDFETKLSTRLRTFMNEEPTEKQVLENFLYLHSPRAQLRRDRIEGERAGGAIRIAHKALSGAEVSPAEKIKLSAYILKRSGDLAPLLKVTGERSGEKSFVTQYEGRVLEKMAQLYGEGKAEEPELDMAA